MLTLISKPLPVIAVKLMAIIIPHQNGYPPLNTHPLHYPYTYYLHTPTGSCMGHASDDRYVSYEDC